MIAKLFAMSGKPLAVAATSMTLAFGAAALLLNPRASTLRSDAGANGSKLQSVAKTSGDGESAEQGSTTARLAAETSAQAIPADAHIKGMWSPVKDWPLIAIHGVLMPDGRVLTYGTKQDGTQTGFFDYDVWTPSMGFGPDAHLTLPNSTGQDIFCSSQVVLPQRDAGVFISGGAIWDGEKTILQGVDGSSIFNYSNNSLTSKKSMVRKRYYPTSTVLPNGEIYIQGGRATSKNGIYAPEIRSVDGSFRELSGAGTGDLGYYYPRNFVAPDGRIFGIDNTQHTAGGHMYYIDTAGAGSRTSLSDLPSTAPKGDGATAVMFRPGKILIFGGSSPRARILDITGGGQPAVATTGALSSTRSLANGTLLADGRVLATGGSAQWNELIDVNNFAEIWNPETGQWLLGAEGSLARLYHSIGLLMPDGTVLVAGGGAVGPLTNLNAEIYYPPYLFNSSGEFATRPVIASAPSTLRVGRSYSVDVEHSRQISRAVLIKNGSVTHNWNMEQRFAELSFSRNGSRITVQMPSRATDTTPGYYMLIVLDDLGVPSVAKTVWIPVAGSDESAPTIVSPGNQTTVTGAAVNLSVAASDPDGDALTYSASGLPTGLSIDPATGRISGSPTAVGSFNATVSVSDGQLTASAGFTWTVNEATPVAFDQLPSGTPTLAGTNVSFTARATGASVSYRWDFGDGTPVSAWSESADIVHQFAAPGAYYVTVSAVSAGGSPATHTFLQVVHLPLTAGRPVVSSNIAYEVREGGPSRVWVVNQDNDSVTAFNAEGLGQEVEIAVGEAPRSIAIAANGQIWVTNKTGYSISIIDPVQMAVATTIKLPRASQPYGIAMSPGGNRAYVALAATGEVMKFDTNKYRKLAAASVGPNPRELAISADGETLFVSRFITPPQPGEDTATVTTSLGGVATGGQVLRLRTSDLVTLGTVTLAHSSRVDGETQGRGVPNYLGAAAISPDGTQAWVPSKQDNIRRGLLRDGNNLNFQNTVRAIASRINLAEGKETLSARIDIDNSSVARAAVFDPLGVFLFVALETSRQVAVLDAHRRYEMFRFDVGRAPDGLVISPDGGKLYVNNFMDRTVGVYDLSPLLSDGEAKVDFIASQSVVGTEKLTEQVLKGKQFFYDARDQRLALDAYLSCASCHNEGGHDGRVWDLTGFGEGLRNTISLTGRAGGQGFLHWSNNFDEVQDFEMQIRNLAGGSGLMNDESLLEGTRQQPLGLRKAGVSAPLDALAAYVESLNRFPRSPYRSGSGLSSLAVEGKSLFVSKGCTTCHAGDAFTGSGANTLIDVGTVKPSSGERLGQALTGIDVPTLRDVWATAPYLHDGSAPTLEAATLAHSNVQLSDAEVASLVSFLKEIGVEEGATAPPPGSGTGLKGIYFNNKTLTAPAVLTRTEIVDFGWNESPGTGVNADGFSVRWSGTVRPGTTGSHRFRTVSNDGVRLWVDGKLLIDNWVKHAKPVTDTSDDINLEAGKAHQIVMEFYEHQGYAEARLSWKRPGMVGWSTVPRDRLYPN